MFELVSVGGLRAYLIVADYRRSPPPLQIYASVLALAAVSTPSKTANLANAHHVRLLFDAWVIYGYRDIYPLGTFTLQPLDLHEGWLMWATLEVLTFVTVIVPAIVPTQYIPFDPKVRPDLISRFLQS